MKYWVACGISEWKTSEKFPQGHRSLMYHSIENPQYDAKDLYVVSFSRFKQQIQALKNYKVKSFASADAGAKDLEISVTFDDGFLDNYTLAMPFLLEQNIPFTVFMVSDYVAPAHSMYLNREHLQEMAKHPLVTIGAHGKTHSSLGELPLSQAISEMWDSKSALEDILGQAVTTMSFPNGSFTPALIEEGARLGYTKMGTSIALGNTKAGVQVDRQAIYFCDGVHQLQQKLQGQWDWMAQR